MKPAAQTIDSKQSFRSGIKNRGGKVVLIAAMAAALAFAMTLTAKAATPTPLYNWYTSAAGTQDDPYVISDVRQWVGFANVVNGTADIDGDGTLDAQDSFAGKFVKLGETLNFRSADLEPVGGGAYGTAFEGSFDGNGKTIRNFTIAVSLEGADAQGATEYIGLFGKTGEASSISNLTVADASISVSITKGDGEGAASVQQPIRYVGAMAGYMGGSVSDVTIDGGTVEVVHEMDQTEAILLPIQWVGGMAGAVQGDLTNCSGSATVSVYAPGAPDPVADQSTIAFGIGGLAGCVGSPDSSVDEATTAISSDIDNCHFSGYLHIDTPCENGIDRFGNQIYALACTAGGIAGYTRGDVTNCTNSGTFVAPHTTAIGGIVGSLRGQFQGSNFVDEGSDDGMVEGAPALTMSNCFNTGSIQGWANSAGIVGRTGTNTTVTGCFNGIASDGSYVHNYVLGGRSTKPFPAGIASSVYGDVCYCANFGEVASIDNREPVDLNAGTYSTGGGYYASGITGILQYYTDSAGNRTQDMPEIYGCFNVGSVRANANMRQRALVGDNEGYVHDCIAIVGSVATDEMFFVESDNGINARCGVILSADLKNNTLVTLDNGTDDEEDDITAYPVALLNSCAVADGWEDYWSLSQNGLNQGYPVVDNQITWESTDIASASVSLEANAEFSGLESVPKAKVVLNGTTLIQDVDFRVEPESGATALTAAGATPYTAQVNGIGAYSGTAQSFAYGIGKGNLANCMVLADPTVFNWDPQLPAEADVHVLNPAGGTVDPSEYTYAINPNDARLTDGEAINAGPYQLIVTASDDSEYFYGHVKGTYTIAKVRIVGGGQGDDTVDASVNSIEYLGETIPWQTTGSSATVPSGEEDLWEAEYTGHSIKPTVSDISYLGRQLVEGRDYRVVYGNATMDGAVDDTPNTEVGDGWIIVRYVSGSNFTNYDLMHFKIVERTGKMNIALGEAICPAQVVYEPGDTGYEPVVVTYGGSELTKDTDYTIEYRNNNALGTASYTVTGIGEFEGTLTGTFELVGGEAFTIQYEYDSPAAGQATVVGVEYNGIRDSFDLVIPETVEHDGATYTVTAVGAKACGGDTNVDFTGSLANTSKLKIASVSIPASVTLIDTQAFGSNASSTQYQMKQLTSVTFADGSHLATIGKQAFANTGLTEITIPAEVVSIGEAAFKGSADISKVTFLTQSASIPTMNLANSNSNSFRNVKNVEAYGYETAAKAQSNVASMNALSGYTWNWNTLEGPEPQVLYGDANGDGSVDSRDALIAVRWSAGKIDASMIDLVAADVDGNGGVDSRDALLIVRYSANKIDHFPVED